MDSTNYQGGTSDAQMEEKEVNVEPSLGKLEYLTMFLTTVIRSR